MKKGDIGEDLRWRVIYLYYDSFSLQEISKLLKISAPTITRIKKCFEQWRCIINPLKGQAGRRKIFNGSNIKGNFILHYFIYIITDKDVFYIFLYIYFFRLYVK